MQGAELAQYRAFIAVAECQNFRQAASQLGIAPSTLSQTIRALETRLALTLFNRTTRSVSLTSVGQQLLQRIKPALLEIDQAVNDARESHRQVAGLLRLTTSQTAARLVVQPILHRFMQRYPLVELDLCVSERVSDIVHDHFDAAIRAGHLVEKDMVAVRLTPDLRAGIVAAPSYLTQNPPPRTPLDLKQHNCIRVNHPVTGQAFAWHFQREGESIQYLPSGSLTLNDDLLARHAMINGAGIGFALWPEIAPFIESGQLVPLLEEWSVTIPGFHIIFPRHRHMAASLRALLDFLKQQSPMVTQE